MLLWRSLVSHTERVISEKRMMFFQRLIGFLSSGEPVRGDPKQIEHTENFCTCNVDVLVTSGARLDPASIAKAWAHFSTVLWSMIRGF